MSEEPVRVEPSPQTLAALAAVERARAAAERAGIAARRATIASTVALCAASFALGMLLQRILGS